MTDTPTITAAQSAPTEDPRTDAQQAFELYWQDLLAKNGGMRTCADAKKLGFLTFADFRTALREAFVAGRESL